MEAYLHGILCDLETGIECAQEEGFFDEYDEFELDGNDDRGLFLKVNGKRYRLVLEKVNG